MPTFDEYVACVSEAVTSGTLRVYQTYWNRIRNEWGDRRLDEPTAPESQQLAERTKETSLYAATGRGGRVAAEHLTGALRCLYQYAVANGFILDRDNPAVRVVKPRQRISGARH